MSAEKGQGPRIGAERMFVQAGFSSVVSVCSVTRTREVLLNE